ncbi:MULTISPECIES: aldehyde dehydrogenase family protein [unclassified Microbacterium]|uniref:aldehyde dehydrogenase family protein n=1 Tax=unclassified Microbacterium TaxID=2609290 RepID=UPI003016B0F2
MTSLIAGVNPATGETLAPVAAATTPAELTSIVGAAAATAAALDGRGRADRAELLAAIGRGLRAAEEEIVDLGVAETGLTAARLRGELARTAYQADFFADVILDGGYLEATIDHAGQTPMGPRPDLRRMLVPIGPVAVFGASNFPLAFSVLGGDTVSALAAGCPVVVKAHSSHPGLSRLSHRIAGDALAETGYSRETVGIVYGTEAGATLVRDPRMAAVGFTGSETGGRALLDIVNSRPEPIPFYGELSSLNPIVVTAAAAESRSEGISQDLFAAVTGSAGQLCTKPGVVLIEEGPEGDGLIARLERLFADAAPQVLLNERIFDAYDDAPERPSGGARTVRGRAAEVGSTGFAVAPRLVEYAGADVPEGAFDEVFGPHAVVIRFQGPVPGGLLDRIPRSLTGTVYAETSEAERTRRIAAALAQRAGRVLFDQVPTGVAVSWAQHHGGPWPSTNTLHTSVGATSIRRFLRPLTWQNAPEDLLPDELRDGAVGLPRRVDGRIKI